MRCGIILAAGDQKRFDNNISKSCMPYKNTTILEENIKTMDKYVDVIYIATNCNNYHEICNLIDYELYNTTIIPIKINSGIGCGDAIFKMLIKININKYTECILIWGDSIQNSDTIYSKSIELIKNIKSSIIIPCIWEKYPYVLFDETYNIITDLRFRKRNEVQENEEGWHDLSFFIFETIYIYKLLYYYYLYISKTNQKEFVFLDMFKKDNNFLSKELNPTILKIEDKHIKSKSFNTISEYENIIDN